MINDSNMLHRLRFFIINWCLGVGFVFWRMSLSKGSSLRTYTACLLKADRKASMETDRYFIYMFCPLSHTAIYPQQPPSSQFALFRSERPQRQKHSDGHAEAVGAWLLVLPSVFFCQPLLSNTPPSLTVFSVSVSLPAANIEPY